MKRIVDYFLGFILFEYIYFHVNQLLIRYSPKFSFHPVLELILLIILISTVFLSLRKPIKLEKLIFRWLLFYFIFIGIFSIWSSEPSLLEWGRLFDIVILIFVIIVAYKFSQELVNYDNQFQNLDQDRLSPNTIIPLEKSEAFVQAEFIRAKRYNYPITLIALRPLNELSKTSGSHIHFFNRSSYHPENINKRIGKFLSNKTRTSDQVIFSKEENVFLLICPELTPENAQDFVDRLKFRVLNEAKSFVDLNYVCFPKEGIMFDALYKKLLRGISENRATGVEEYSTVVHGK